MKLSGNYKLDLKKEAVWKALNDPNILKQCIPGCETFDKKDNTHFSITATNQIGPMNATFSGDVNLSDIIEYVGSTKNFNIYKKDIEEYKEKYGS